MLVGARWSHFALVPCLAVYVRWSAVHTDDSARSAPISPFVCPSTPWIVLTRRLKIRPRAVLPMPDGYGSQARGSSDSECFQVPPRTALFVVSTALVTIFDSLVPPS